MNPGQCKKCGSYVTIMIDGSERCITCGSFVESLDCLDESGWPISLAVAAGMIVFAVVVYSYLVLFMDG